MSLFTNRFYSQFNNNNVNESIYNFERALYQSYDQCCPIQTKQVSQNTLNKPWITPDIVLLIGASTFFSEDTNNVLCPFISIMNIKITSLDVSSNWF